MSIPKEKKGESVASYQRGEPKEKKKPRIVSYTLEELDALEGKTDWERVHNMTDEEIDAAVASDPDAEPITDFSGFKWYPHPPKAKTISIRLDADLYLFYRSWGRGYQTRIKEVLRDYMENFDKMRNPHARVPHASRRAKNAKRSNN